MANSVYEPESEKTSGQDTGYGYSSRMRRARQPDNVKSNRRGGAKQPGESDSGQDSSAASPSELRQEEEKGQDERGFYNPQGDDSEDSNDEIRDKEEDPDKEPEEEGDLWHQDGKKRVKGRFQISKRKIAVGGALTGFVVGGSAFFFTAVLGPMQAIHWSEILQKPGNKSEKASAQRSRLYYRFFPLAARDVGETRVSVSGRKYLRDTVQQLSDIGVTFNKNSLDGLKSIEIDMKKLAKEYPELKDMSRKKQRAWLSDHFDKIPKKNINYIDGKFYVGGEDFSLKTTALLKNKSVALLDRGVIQSALKKRILAKYLDVPGLFSPIRKTTEKLHSGLSNAELEAEKKRQAALTEAVEAKGDAAIKNIEDKSSKYNSAVMKALMFTGSACFVKSVSGDIVTVNRTRTFLPAAIKSLDLIALGAQAKAGKNITMKQLGAALKNLNDSKGNGIGQSKALKAMSGVKNPGGTDISEDMKQAFMPNATAATFESGANHALGGKFLAGLACSGIGQAIQLAAGLGASAISAFGEVASAGTLTPAIVGLWAAKEGATFAISAVAMHYVSQYILDKTTAEKLAADAFKGPAGGSLIAYGAVGAASMGSIAEGGVKTADAITGSTFGYGQEDEEFESKSYFARVFDAEDYRSLTGRMIDSINPSISQNATSMVASLSNVGGLFGNLLSPMIPKAAADTQPYQWGMPEYGIPSEILDDPNLINPYENAETVATLLDTDGGKTYLEKARSCFGVDINKDSGVWDVLPQEDVNPASSDYTDANCDDISDYNWRRVILFVFDTRTMASITCYLGDEQSCQDVTGSTSVSGSSSTPDDSSEEESGSTDIKELAKEMLENSNITYWTNKGVNTRDVVTRMSETGKAFTTSNDAYAKSHRAVDMNPAVLQFILYLAQDSKVMVNALTDKDHSSTSKHYQGIAVDLDCSTEADKAKLDEAAAKFGGRNNGEVCLGDSHWHYDFPKN